MNQPSMSATEELEKTKQATLHCTPPFPKQILERLLHETAQRAKDDSENTLQQSFKQLSAV